MDPAKVEALMELLGKAERINGEGSLPSTVSEAIITKCIADIEAEIAKATS